MRWERQEARKRKRKKKTKQVRLGWVGLDWVIGRAVIMFWNRSVSEGGPTTTTTKMTRGGKMFGRTPRDRGWMLRRESR